MAFEWFRRPVVRDDRSVGEFIRDHYGDEAVDYLAEPLLSGVYGGDPDEMSAASVLPRFVAFERKYGSVTRGVMAERVASQGPLFQTMKNGLGQLIDALEPKCEVIRGTVESIEPGYRLRINGNWLAADAVILACGPRSAAILLGASAISDLLRAIPYRSSHIVALAFRRAELKHPLDGFGFLVPKRERRRMIGCTWVTTKFSHRAPADYALLRCFFGSEASEADALAELQIMMGIRAQPAFSRIFNWPDSMPQYTVGHARRMTEIAAQLENFPGLTLAGNAYHGIGIPDCIRLAKAAAEKTMRGTIR
jgi:oxygen-dependent protoporphyrinogen oxidase